jgi:hypothetical protein
MEERFLYHIWDEGHIISAPHCVSQKQVKVVYQGQFNTGRGPDFKNAIIELDGRQIRGDVEIHLKTTDWHAHNHHEDVYYNQVVLHVVLKHNSVYPVTIREDGNAIDILEIEHQLSEDILKLVSNHDPTGSPAVYCDLLSAVDNHRLEAILHSAGIRRFEAKIKRFNTALSLSSFDQIFYEGLFEALGYNKNKLNTLQIAQSLPLVLLRDFAEEGMTAPELCAIVLGSCGLLKRAGSMLDNEDQKALLDLYESQKFFARNLDIDWQLFRIRPQNHPLKRLLYIAPIIHSTLSEGLFHHFLNNIAFDNLYNSFKAIWQNQHNPTRTKALTLGKGVQDNIYLNIFLPVLCLWQRKMAKDDHPVLDAYKNFNALQENYITRFMHRYLSPSQIPIVQSKAIYQQGLMDLYHRYCNWHLCQECKLRATRTDAH